MKKQLFFLSFFSFIAGTNYQAWGMKEKEEDLMEKAATVDAGIDKERLELQLKQLQEIERLVSSRIFLLPKTRDGLLDTKAFFEKLFAAQDQIEPLVKLNPSLQDKWNMLITIKNKIDSLLTKDPVQIILEILAKEDTATEKSE